MRPDEERPSEIQDDRPVKVIAFVRKLPELSREEFARRWTTEHVSVSRQLGMTPYRINLARDGLDDQPAMFDGTAEMYWPSLAALKAALASPQGLLAAKDTQRFASEVRLMLVDEVTIT